MGEAKFGEEFITHEYDEAIAVQQCIVDAETTLSTSHPMRSSKVAIKASLADDKSFLSELKKLGKPHGATGKVEDVAGGLKDLMEETLQTASKDGADSDYYEAHAVLLNIKRKQMDSAGGMLEIARATKDTDLRTAASNFQRVQKTAADALAAELGAFAAKIATSASKTSVAKTNGTAVGAAR
jgi:histone H3/H4